VRAHTAPVVNGAFCFSSKKNPRWRNVGVGVTLRAISPLPVRLPCSVHCITSLVMHAIGSFWDVLSDINLFYEVAAIQMASTVLPITSILPDSIVSWIIQGANAGNLNDRYAAVAVTALPPISPVSLCLTALH
jgi:hypothetical protein